MNIIVDMVRRMVLDKVRTMNLPTYSDPLEALQRFPWNFPSTLVKQRQFAEWNLSLDGRSCLGRVAQSAALLELQFPNASVTCGEVLVDQLREDMMRRIRVEGLPRDQGLRQEWFTKVLMYEQSHSVIIVDGVQFDPLSTKYGQEIRHPHIQLYPVWEIITASIMVSQAWLNPNPDSRLVMLDFAEWLCPGTAIVAENRMYSLFFLGRRDEVMRIVQDLIQRRPTAELLFYSWGITGNPWYVNQIRNRYGVEMIDHLKIGAVT
jgi:hypothetical protein